MSTKDLSKSLTAQLNDIAEKLENIQEKSKAMCSESGSNNKRIIKALKQIKKAKKKIKKASNNLIIGYSVKLDKNIDKGDSTINNQDANKDNTIKTVYRHKTTKNKPD